MNIVVKGTGNGTVTDFDSNFEITANPDATIVASFLGFKTIEIPLEGRTKISVELETDSEQLSELVVMGYGRQLKEDITSAVYM